METVDRTTGFDTIFSKSDQVVVSPYASLPVEVHQVLKTADFFRDAYIGGIDTQTGFALIASIYTCFVWKYNQALKGTPSCYIFACPTDDHPSSPPFYSIFPYSSSREPGLLLLSLNGRVRFWESIGVGLAGGNHYTTVDLLLSPGEQVTNFIRSDAQTYVISTTMGSLLRFTLLMTGGKHQFSTHPFTQPSQQRSLFRLFPSIFTGTSNSVNHSRNISALALGNVTANGGRYIWALVDTSVQKWEMKPEGWEEMILQCDLSRSLVSEIQGTLDADFGDVEEAEMDLELLDLAIDDQTIVILCSYACGSDAKGHSSLFLDPTGVRRIYAVVHVSLQDGGFAVQSRNNILFKSSFITGAPMHPRLQLIHGSALVGAQFGDAVTLNARDVNYRERFELKAPTDRNFGMGIVKNGGPLLVLTAGLILKVSISLEKIFTYDVDYSPAMQVKSSLTQAISYSSLPGNPLHFSLPPDVDDEALMQGAIQLSRELLNADPQLVHKNHDLGAHLGNRREGLELLIQFINANSALAKISQQTRQQLVNDAEKLFSAEELWLQHDKLLMTNPSCSILSNVVLTYMEEIGEGHHEDVMRKFFRDRVSEIGNLLQKVVGATNDASTLTGKDIMYFLPEANRIILTIIQSAFRFREHYTGTYGIQFPMIAAWTSQTTVIDAALGIFRLTAKTIDRASATEGVIERNKDPYLQLPDIATILFACIQERLDWLSSGIAASQASNERDREELARNFDILRPEVFNSLHRYGHALAAFSLAEKYHDFVGLAVLCQKQPSSSGTIPDFVRIASYAERFKGEFTRELYRWYVQNGQLGAMFALDGSHSDYIDEFFVDHPNNLISWINDVGKGKYQKTASGLLVAAEEASNLAAKHLMLSIGKLSHLAQMNEGQATEDNAILDTFHDGLDLVSVQEVLVEQFRDVLKKFRGRHPIESQIDFIMNSKASCLNESPAHCHILRGLIRDLLRGKALAVEDVVDVLTLKDNQQSPEDFATALQLLFRSQNLVTARQTSAYRTVWRRIYLHDDWEVIGRTANVSDSEINNRFRNTALYITFCMTMAKGKEETAYMLPEETLEVPTQEEIATRWAGLSADEVERLMQDYDTERDKLGEMDLNEIYRRVKKLAAEDIRT